MRHLIEGSLGPADRARDPYLELPFAVPAGTTRLEVRYRHDEGSVLDIGLLEPGTEPFPARRGFRGWSGGARREFFVARDAATPGYLPGELPAGRWRLLLGLARVAPTGCRYRIEIVLDDGERPPLLEAPAPALAPAGAGWYRGDLHSHSWYSDARGTLADLVMAARSRRLDFLAVTDHNTNSHHRELAELGSRELLLVPGQEVTTYRGHANVWGVDGWVDFRVRRPEDLQALVEQVHARGGLFSINHPKSHHDCIGCDWEYPVPAASDAFEAWQGPWLLRNWESLERYDRLLASGRRLTLVGGSDRHQPGWPDPDPALLQLGSPTTWLELEELSVPAVLAALRAGRACVSDDPRGPRLDIAVAGTSMGGHVSGPLDGEVIVAATARRARGLRLRWLGEAGVLREVDIASEGVVDRWSWRPRGAFLRAEIVAAADPQGLTATYRQLERAGTVPAGLRLEELLGRPWVRALSNPVYLPG